MEIHQIEISHPDKYLFPKEKISKADVADYYDRIAPYLLPFLKNRPLTLRRYPEGIEQDGFFNKHAPDYFPDFIERFKVPMEKGQETMKMVAVHHAKDLVYLANQNTIELHIPLATMDHLHKPDQIIFDFDPSDNDFEKVRYAAIQLNDFLQSKQISTFVKTTGSRGLHVHIPIHPNCDFDKVKPIAKQIAEALNQHCPDITTLEQRKEKRGSKVFIDYLRNDYSMTAVAPYSLRAKPDAPIATPIDWQELKNQAIKPQTYTLQNIFRRTSHKTDPWNSFGHKRVDIQKLDKNELRFD